MAASVNISREEWLKEMETKSASSQAFEAFVAVERFVVEKTPLEISYRRGPGGNATFCGSATGPGRSCCVVQILRGHCEIMCQWQKPIPGLSEARHAQVNEAFNLFRRTLNGSPGKGYQKIMVLRLGVENVNTALLAVATELTGLLA